MSTILDIENTPMAADKRNVPNRLRTDIVKDIIFMFVTNLVFFV